MTLTFREFCTILAALRVFQEMSADARREMDHFDDVAPLTDAEIDDICERLYSDEVPE